MSRRSNARERTVAGANPPHMSIRSTRRSPRSGPACAAGNCAPRRRRISPVRVATGTAFASVDVRPRCDRHGGANPSLGSAPRGPIANNVFRKFRCAREAGAVQPVEVRPRKGSSVLPGSECCVADGDVGCEAYAAIERGGLLSHEMPVAEAETVRLVAGHISVPVMRGVAALPRSKTPSRSKGSRRNLGVLTSGRWRSAPRSALGRRGAEANDART